MKTSELIMYFTVTMAFVNYLDSLDNLTDISEFLFCIIGPLMNRYCQFCTAI